MAFTRRIMLSYKYVSTHTHTHTHTHTQTAPQKEHMHACCHHHTRARIHGALTHPQGGCEDNADRRMVLERDPAPADGNGYIRVTDTITCNVI